MQETSNASSAHGDVTVVRDEKKERAMSKRVSLIFSSVFNPRKRRISKSHSIEVQRNGDGDDDLSDHQAGLAEEQVPKRSEQSDEAGEDEKAFHKEIEKQEKGYKEKGGNSKKPRKPSGSVSLSKSFYKKSCSFSCIAGNVTKLDTSGSLSTSNSYSSNTTSFSFNSQNHSNSTGRTMGRQGSSRSLSRVPSRILTSRQKLKIAHSLAKMGSGKKSRKEDGDECESLISTESGRKSDWGDKNGGVELCKKRILMGWRCRPLNKSGILEYDKDGILLPDIVP